MPTDLPPAVAAYFAADGRTDAAALARTFTEDATVRDEGAVHHGRAAIADWWRSAKDRYHHTIEPLSASEQDGKIIVCGKVSGTFPGSPAELAFAFALAGDRISSLEIG